MKKEAEKALQHKKLFQATEYQPFSCLLDFNPLEIVVKSKYLRKEIILSNDIKVARLRNIQNRNTIIFFQLFFMYVASTLHLEH